MRKNKIMMIISILLLIIMLLGTTFSYFAASAKADQNIDIVAANFDAGVTISEFYGGKSLIPMNDSDVMTGYNNQCVDDLGYGACYAYNIHVENTGDKFSYVGSIDFDVTDIENLKYLVLDEENNKYVEDTLISGEDQTLGDSFELDTGESRDFVLVIWLSNLEGPQDDQDAGGNFSASVTYESTYGSKITGTFSVN